MGLNTETILELEARHGSGVYGKRGVALVRGRGARVWDSEGRELIDCAAGHGVANVGHSHPRVVEAVRAQSERLITCAEAFQSDRRAEYCSALAEQLPGSMQRIFLCNSGTEAVEAALKFARFTTGRSGVVATLRGFHGRTFGALSATWEKKFREPFAPLVPGFEHVRFDDLEAAAAAITDETACVLVEVVQGEGGVRPGSSEYFRGLRRLCDERGALLILDEVQTGFGRTGRMFACERHGVTPDILCLGKAIAGGLPMGAVGLAERVGDLKPGLHGSTFGGNPLACAAASAVLEVLHTERLVERAESEGEWLRKRLSAIDSPLVREVRGLGLMLGVELKTRVTPILRSLMEEGVIALPAGSTVLRLLPPLTIERGDLERVVDGIERCLRAAEGTS